MSVPPIVLVEDDPTIVSLLTFALGQEGWKVISAADGEEGLARIREHSPALAIVDAMMPKLDGYDLCAAVRSETGLERRPYVIMLTALGRDVDRDRATAAGVDEFMTKPFTPSVLRERITDILKEAG